LGRGPAVGVGGRGGKRGGQGGRLERGLDASEAVGPTCRPPRASRPAPPMCKASFAEFVVRWLPCAAPGGAAGRCEPCAPRAAGAATWPGRDSPPQRWGGADRWRGSSSPHCAGLYVPCARLGRGDMPVWGRAGRQLLVTLHPRHPPCNRPCTIVTTVNAVLERSKGAPCALLGDPIVGLPVRFAAGSSGCPAAKLLQLV
jgi:hypothetical protein